MEAGGAARPASPASGTLWGSAWRSELRKSCEVRAAWLPEESPPVLLVLSPQLLAGVESRSGMRETVEEAAPATRLETCPQWRPG